MVKKKANYADNYYFNLWPWGKSSMKIQVGLAIDSKRHHAGHLFLNSQSAELVSLHAGIHSF